MRYGQSLDFAFVFRAEYVPVLQFLQEVILDEISLFAAGTVKEEDCGVLSDDQCHVCFLTWDDDLGCFMEVAEVPGKPALTLISRSIDDEDDFSAAGGQSDLVVQFLLPRAEGVGFAHGTGAVVVDVLIYEFWKLGAHRAVHLSQCSHVQCTFFHSVFKLFYLRILSFFSFGLLFLWLDAYLCKISFLFAIDDTSREKACNGAMGLSYHGYDLLQPLPGSETHSAL